MAQKEAERLYQDEVVMSLPGWGRDEVSGAKVNSHSRQALAQIMKSASGPALLDMSICPAHSVIRRLGRQGPSRPNPVDSRIIRLVCELVVCQ